MLDIKLPTPVSRALPWRKSNQRCSLHHVQTTSKTADELLLHVSACPQHLLQLEKGVMCELTKVELEVKPIPV